MKQRAFVRSVFGLAAVGLSGCATMGGEVQPDQGRAAQLCNAEPAQDRVGLVATQSSGTAILKASGARTLRWGPPNSAWTMDYREDRVNVRYDSAMNIVEITCG